MDKGEGEIAGEATYTTGIIVYLHLTCIASTVVIAPDMCVSLAQVAVGVRVSICFRFAFP